jgi:hypothetical protein
MCGFPRSPRTSRETNAASRTLDLPIADVYNPDPHREQSSRIKVRIPTTSCIVC